MSSLTSGGNIMKSTGKLNSKELVSSDEDQTILMTG
jgi:hypothetical protein